MKCVGGLQIGKLPDRQGLTKPPIGEQDRGQLGVSAIPAQAHAEGDVNPGQRFIEVHGAG